MKITERVEIKEADLTTPGLNMQVAHTGQTREELEEKKNVLR